MSTESYTLIKTAGVKCQKYYFRELFLKYLLKEMFQHNKQLNQEKRHESLEIGNSKW